MPCVSVFVMIALFVVRLYVRFNETLLIRARVNMTNLCAYLLTALLGQQAAPFYNITHTYHSCGP